MLRNGRKFPRWEMLRNLQVRAMLGMNHWKFDSYPKGAAPWPRRVATATPQSGSSTWELPCISIFSMGWGWERQVPSHSPGCAWEQPPGRAGDSRGSTWSSSGVGAPSGCSRGSGCCPSSRELQFLGCSCAEPGGDLQLLGWETALLQMGFPR